MSIKVPKSPAYLWYPKDVLDSPRVDDLSATEECWYRRALDRSWGDEGVPADPVKAAKRIGKKCTVKAAAMILKIFFTPKKKDPSKMVNLRQEKERKKYEDNFRKKSNAGRESGRKRRQYKELGTEHRSNNVQGMNELSIPSSIPISFSDEKDFKRLIERCTRENSKIDPRIIEIGILYTMLQRNGSTEPIKSVKYFEPEIKKIELDSKGLGTQAIDALLERRRQQFWQQEKRAA